MVIRTLKASLLGSVALGVSAIAAAQDADTEDGGDALKFDTVVVTASPSADTTLFETSVSVSSVTLDEINDFAPRSTTEIFRNIPGIRSESSGGEGNANIVVRGLPLAAGGSRFVQLQEDGLPILAFGDITFATQDQWLRADTTISRVEAIRGGSASTFASNAPGAVINFISKTGKEEGGEIGLTRGIGFDTTRVDFEYGSPITDSLFFHVGGFYRVGEGPREIGFNGEEGGQIKANITKEFENGFVRLNFKHLNDRTFPSFPQPFVIEGGDAQPIPGFDGRDEALVSNNLLTVPRLDVGGAPTTTDLTDGIRAIATSIGGEFEFDIGSGFTIANKAKFSANDGGFLGVFPTAAIEAETFAETLPGGETLAFLGGINDGAIIEDPASLNGNGLIATQLVFDVNLEDLSQFVNDFQLRRSFETEGFGEFDVSFGYYKSIQQLEADWFFTFFGQEVQGDDAALIDILDADGNSLTASGFFDLDDFNPLFDLEFDRDAVYGSVNWQFDRLTVDGSVRYEDVQAFGETNLAAPEGSTAGGFVDIGGVDINNDGVVTPVVEEDVTVVDTANLFGIDYNVDYVAYSVGANYAVTDDLALFARFSRGGVVNGDRLILGAGAATFNLDGGLTAEGSGLDIARQAEWGVKYRTADQFFPGALDLFVTGFYSDVEISTFDITEVDAGALDQVFESFGVEFEANYNWEFFNLAGSFTFTDAELVENLSDPSLVGNTPQRQADFIYTVTPSFSFNTPVRWDVGANIVGTTSSFAQDDNVIVQPGFFQLNLFLNVDLLEDLTASLNVNNANNAFGITEINDFTVPDNGILRGRSIPGRTISASLRYRF